MVRDMKRKLAVFGNGWTNEYLQIVMSGIRKCADENNMDIFLFMNYSVSKAPEIVERGEANIFLLPHMEDFDGAILLANTFHGASDFAYLKEKLSAKNIPAVSLEYEIEGMDSLETDNYTGMFELTRHLVEDHQVKKFLLVCGPQDNLESNCRKDAVIDALSQAGICLEENNIIYGLWSYNVAVELVGKWLEEHKDLPDAIVCLNDIMAMACCSTLKQRGIKVPQQVKVTGFDNLQSGKAFSPMITTVDRGWENLGYQGAQYIVDRLAGKEVLKKPEKIKTKLVPGESCGCDVTDKKVLEDINNSSGYGDLVSFAFFGGRLCDIAEIMSNIITEEEFHRELGAFWEKGHPFEGDELYVCLHDKFFSVFNESEPLQKIGYGSTMNMICGLKDGKLMDRCMFKTRQLVPNYDADAKKSRMYVFMPLYIKNNNFGYVVFGDEVPMIYDYGAYTWSRHLSQNLERVRQNIKLEEMNNKLIALSITDALTGLYNRLGCDEKVLSYLEKCQKEGKSGVVMFADINKMKRINDKYGHLQGDIAICTTARVIKEVLPEDWIQVRYGGDEFLIVGHSAGEAQLNAYADKICEYLKEQSKMLQLPYIIKVGIGFTIVEAGQEFNLAECLRRADEAMYVKKSEQHKEEEKEEN